jgi:hypothetical protein
VSGEREQAFIVWLVDVLHYPYDVAFDNAPPPVDHGRLADYWNESDGWGLTSEEARAAVYEEAGLCSCGCLPAMHVGEIGCPCALPGEPPCVPSTSEGEGA